MTETVYSATIDGIKQVRFTRAAVRYLIDKINRDIDEEPDRDHDWDLNDVWLLEDVERVLLEALEAPRPRDELQQLRHELEGYREAALYDPMMSGESRFKGWNRSALDRARRVTEARIYSGSVIDGATANESASAHDSNSTGGENGDQEL